MPEIPDIPEELPLAAAAETTRPAPKGETVEIAATEDVAEIPANVKEETPVLDVHMPHAAHTWKDFFIHLGTITAGLLIAISLEQSVEKLHHLHQRHELEASLRAEAAMNKERAEVDFARYDDEMTWLLGLHEDIGKGDRGMGHEETQTRFADDYGKMAQEVEAEDAARDRAAEKSK
jgi:hypothetical protein